MFCFSNLCYKTLLKLSMVIITLKSVKLYIIYKRKKALDAHLNQQCSKLYVIAYVIKWRTLNLIGTRTTTLSVGEQFLTLFKRKHVIHDFVGKLSWKIVIVSNSLFFFVWKRKWMQFADGGTSRISEFDTIWYLILQGELQAPLFRWYGYDMICQIFFFLN